MALDKIAEIPVAALGDDFDEYTGQHLNTHDVTLADCMVVEFNVLAELVEKATELEALEKQLFPLTLKELASKTIVMANQTEGKKATHYHLLTDDDSYKWERIQAAEKMFGTSLYEIIDKAIRKNVLMQEL